MELLDKPAIELLSLMKKGEVTSTELTRAVLDTIEQKEP